MRDTTSRISVIIPTLQEQNYIEATLSRLLKVEPSVEVIVVDGGSQDKTVEVAQRFTQKVYQISRRGIAAGRNYGARRANGDILVFLDADVAFPTTFPEKLLQTFKDSTVVGATCNVMPLHNESGMLAFFKLYNLAIRVTAKFKPHARGEFFTVRKTAFQKAKGFDETMPCLEDHDLANRLSKLGKFIFISDLTVCESLRRFKKLSFREVVGTWIVDYFLFTILGRPLSVEWKPVR